VPAQTRHLIPETIAGEKVRTASAQLKRLVPIGADGFEMRNVVIDETQHTF
jgi:hypothetical protein